MGHPVAQECFSRDMLFADEPPAPRFEQRRALAARYTQSRENGSRFIDSRQRECRGLYANPAEYER